MPLNTAHLPERNNSLTIILGRLGGIIKLRSFEDQHLPIYSALYVLSVGDDSVFSLEWPLGVYLNSQIHKLLVNHQTLTKKKYY